MAYYDVGKLDTHGIGARIRKERERRSMSRAALAKQVGISETALSYLEAGGRFRGKTSTEFEASNPTMGPLFGICNALEFSLEYLLGLQAHPKDGVERTGGRLLSLAGLTERDRVRITAMRDVFLSLEGQELEALEAVYGKMHEDRRLQNPQNGDVGRD